MKKYLPYLPAFILSLGALLRITGTGASALWFDEANTIRRSGITFLTLWHENSENSGDLLLELLIRPLMAIGHSVWMLRLPSMLAGLISLWLVWKLMHRLDFTLKQQVITSVIVAILPGLLWIAQDGRAYGLLALLALAALWFAMESQWLGLLAVCGLMVYAHNTGPIYAAGALVVAAYLFPWKIKRILIVGALSLLAWIPAAVHMLTNWIVQQPWQPQLTASWFLYSSIRAIWPELYPTSLFFIFTLVLIRTVFYLFHSTLAHGRIVPLLAWSVPVLCLALFSFATANNMVLYRTLMPALFPFALWLGWEIGRPRKVTVFNFDYAWTFALLFGLLLWSPAQRGGGLDKVAADIRSQWRTGDTLVYTTQTVALPFEHYLGDLPSQYDRTIQAPFLAFPAGDSAPAPLTAVQRSWVIIPEDGLVTPGERAALMALVDHQPPLYTVPYMQAAQIDIYLVEEK